MPKGSANLINYLAEYVPANGSQTNRAYLIDITLTSGQTISVLTGCNLTSITYNSTTYYRVKYGTWELEEMSFEASFRPNANSFKLSGLFVVDTPQSGTQLPYPGTSSTMLQAVNAGVFNGATVRVQVIYWPTFPGGYPSRGPYTTFTLPNTNVVSGATMGTLPLQVGQIGNIESTGRSKVDFEVYDLIYLMNRPVPPHELQSPCRHTLFNAGCTLLQANFQSTDITLSTSSTGLYLNAIIPQHQTSHHYNKGNVMVSALNGVVWFANTTGTTAGSAPSFATTTRGNQVVDGGVTWISMGPGDASQLGYTQGWGIFTSGQNNGLRFAIKLDAGPGPNDPGPVDTEQFQLIRPMPFPVAGGDTIQILPGCDKTISTCSKVYNNLIHFGGTPFVPNPELAGSSGG